MSRELKVLIIEDSEDDALLLLRELKRGGYNPVYERVHSLETLDRSLEHNQWDIIISDYVMPGFSGLAALKFIKDRGLDIPFIVVSGNIGEDMAVAAMKAGAHDYIIKGNLTRLIPAIERELSEVEVRKERNRADEALATEKERLAVTLRSIADGVIATDASGSVLLINEVAESLTEWTQNQAQGKHISVIFKLFDEQSGQRYLNPLQMLEYSNRGIKQSTDALLKSKTGLSTLISYNAAPIRNSRSETIGTVVVFRNITQKRKIEEEMLKASKLESVGLLAGGIAHDFNNILTAVMSNLFLLKTTATQDSEIFTRLVELENSVMLAKNLTQQLLTFSKGGLPITKTSTIKDLLKESVDFALRGSNISCELTIAEDLWPVEIDEGQINQVINNLIINAQQAMPNGGKIHITAENLAHQPLLPLEPTSYIKLTIKDQGVGIAKEHINNIFDPYFTTKPNGTGLGLTTSYSIIKNHKGYIYAESELGNGTTFYIYLPASKNSQVEKKELKPAITGKGRVLFMEDNRALRELMPTMLERFGFEVVVAKDGIETVEAFKEAFQAQNPFDVVIMDLTIPGGMGGKETIKKLLEVDPNVKSIVSSGYSNDPVMADFKTYGFRSVVVKPYRAEELADVIFSVMFCTD